VLNIISIDVEDYFHPSEVRRAVAPELWGTLPSRVEAATSRVLDLLARHEVAGTFFVLGWVAERHPALVRRIAEAGHEVACHSYAHRLVFEMTPEEFRADTLRVQAVIADACGRKPVVYRAPSYSIVERSMWALEILAELGFTHDSSIYPIAHDRYGIPGFSRHARMVETPSGPIMEVPIATVNLPGGTVAPVGGGAYLRLLPYCYTAAGLRRINHQERRPACLYFHPWELDSGQPRLAQGLFSRVRTYSGLNRMEAKLDALLSDFRFSTLTAVHSLAPSSPSA
jgi:polysaccharide deacetylase family protein (PEP-CTERM system associated)